MRDAIYIGNTQQTFNKLMDINLSDLLLPLKNGQNMTHLLPISSITLNLLCHVHT